MLVNEKDLQPFQAKDKNLHSNRIIDSRQEFTLLEKKIIYCVINQLEVSTSPQEDLFGDKRFKIPVSTFGTDYSFTTLKQAINKLTTRNISGGNNKKEEAWSITPIPSAKIKNGFLEVVLYSEAVPYFIDLKKRGYTAYELDVAMSLTSVYSQRMFELLSRYKDTGSWFETIDRFKFLMGVDKEKTFTGVAANGKLKEKILEPARKELAEKTDIEFDYSFEKEGRKFVAINFKVYTKKIVQQMNTADAKADARDVVEQLVVLPQGQQMVFFYQAFANYQFNDKQKKQILADQRLIAKFTEIHTQIMTGAITVETTSTRLMAWHLRQLGLR